MNGVLRAFKGTGAGVFQRKIFARHTSAEITAGVIQGSQWLRSEAYPGLRPWMASMKGRGGGKEPSGNSAVRSPSRSLAAAAR